jgi:hypothetical protein
MRSTLHKLLTCTLLATYVGISLLGQGLHELTPGHEHHHGFEVVTCTAHTHGDGDCCEHHQHGESGHHDDHDSQPVGPVVAATDGASDSHTCEICEFLVQAVSQPPQIATVPDLHPLVAVAATPHVEIYSQAILGLHAARGPPHVVA